VKPIIIIVISLVFIIGMGCWTLNQVTRSSDRLLSLSGELEEKIGQNLWNDAGKVLEDIKSTWNSTKTVWTILLNHKEIDNIDITVVKLEQYINTGEVGLSLAEAASLKFLFQHIRDKERPTLKNIF